MNGAKISSYRTTLDSARIQSDDLKCGDTDVSDYMYHRRLLRGSAIQGRGVYRYNWFHCDDWSELNVMSEKKLGVPAENTVSGLDTGSGRTWTFEGTSAIGNLQHYTWIIGYKRLIIAPGEIRLLASAPNQAVIETVTGAPILTVRT